MCAGCGDSSHEERDLQPMLQSVAPELLEGAIFADAEAARLLAEADPQRFGELPAAVASGSYEQAALDAARWRRLDREQRFSLIIWAGDPANARALFQHLLAARDWWPIHLDADVLVFARSGGKWSANAAEISGKTPDALSRIAARLIAIEERTLARDLLERSLASYPAHHDTLVLLATLEAARERWQPALQHARAALGSNPDSVAALYLEAQALFALGKPGEATRPLDRLIEKVPDNPTYLFLEAKIAHALSQFDREIRALESILSALKSSGMPTVFYEIYLAQAYASNGENARALALFDQLEKQSELTTGQKDFVQRATVRLREALEK